MTGLVGDCKLTKVVRLCERPHKNHDIEAFTERLPGPNRRLYVNWF